MSIDFAVCQIQWRELETALEDGSIVDPLWDNEFAWEDVAQDFLFDNDSNLALYATTYYIQLRPQLEPAQRSYLDEIVGGLIWNCDVEKPDSPPFAAPTNVCDAPELADNVQFLLSPESVHAFKVSFDAVNWEHLLSVAHQCLGSEKLIMFGRPEELVDYIAEWGEAISRASKDRVGLLAVMMI